MNNPPIASDSSIRLFTVPTSFGTTILSESCFVRGPAKERDLRRTAVFFSETVDGQEIERADLVLFLVKTVTF